VTAADTFVATPSSAPLPGTLPPDKATAPAERVDPLLVQQTKAEIRRLVREIGQVSQADLPLNEFCEQFLGRVVSALAAVGGAIWMMDENGGLRLRYHVNFAQTRLAEDERASARHASLLKKTAIEARPVLVPPESGTATEVDAGNPTEWLLVLGVLRGDDGAEGIVEIFQRPSGGPVTHRGYLRFLGQMCDLANDYLRNRRLRQLKRDRQLWKGTEQFVQAIHRSLDVRATAFAIANEGRRLTEADRLSVAVRRGKRCEVLAVSGLDTIDRRAEEVARMSRLAAVVTALGEPLWHPQTDVAQPPQIEEVLEPYVDKSHSRTIGVLPLRAPGENADVSDEQTSPPFGALIVEQFRNDSDIEELARRGEAVARSGAVALANALEHNSLPARPLWKCLGKLKAAIGRRALPKTIAAAIAVVSTVLGLALFPAELRIPARGRIGPAVQQHIFAHIDGTVIEVPVTHAQMVDAGQVLARMRNTDLEVDITTLAGRKRTTIERMFAIQGALLKHADLPPQERNRLSGELAQLKQTVDGIDRQLELYRRKEEQLIVRSPKSGQVVTWHVGDVLLERPVQRGQMLMSIADPDGDWNLELYVHESDIRHVVAAGEERAEEGPASGELGDSQGGVKVTFTLHTHPGRVFEGHVIETQETAEDRGPDGNLVKVRVAVNKDQLPELRSGAGAGARIHCGTHSIGYVWFRDVIEAAQQKLWL